MGLYDNVILLASSAGFILYQTCSLHGHDEFSFLWWQESCLLLILAAEKPDLCLLVSVVSTHTQPRTKKECEVIPQIAWIMGEKTRRAGLRQEVRMLVTSVLSGP